MSIMHEVVQWIAQHSETIRQGHDTLMDELLRYCNVFVAYHQVRGIDQGKEDKKGKDPSAPNQENNEDSSKK
ncbi:hypothetical protein D3C75_466860 [compost metagenome]